MCTVNHSIVTVYTRLLKNLNLKRGVGIAIKSKETNSSVANKSGVKIIVGHRPISGQINNMAAHFLVCLTHFKQV